MATKKTTEDKRPKDDEDRAAARLRREQQARWFREMHLHGHTHHAGIADTTTN